MPKELPENWTTLTVAEYKKVFSIRGNFPSNLAIYRKQKSPNIYARYLPDKENDPRTHRSKRLYREASQGTDDPFQAAKKAVVWANNDLAELLEKKDLQEGVTKKSLVDYWNIYFAKACVVKEDTVRKYSKWKRDELLKWESAHYGISQQPWSKISVDRVSRQHLNDYFDLLETQARKTNGTNGYGMKGQQKTVLNKLFKEAESDFVGHSFPSFPPISKNKDQVHHFNKTQWETLIKKVIELSGGAAQKALTKNQYENLDFKKHRLDNQRNWVDLYDALLLEWFFYLRSEDMPRLRTEWFSDAGDQEIICWLVETKKDRPKHRTTHYRSDAYKFWKRLSKRRSNSGWLVAPHIPRQEEGGAENGVRNRLNSTLKIAIKECLPNFSGNRSWTTIRHTAFRLTLEDDPRLGQQPLINDFAANGHSSADELWVNYLNYIQQESTAKKARAKIKPSEYSLVRNTKNK